MIQRLYVHNFRCLENFELKLGGKASSLLIGKNGAGKSTVSFALEVLQKIARGTNRIGQLVRPADFYRSRTDGPMRFEVDVDIQDHRYQYQVAFEYPPGFRELRIQTEGLWCDGLAVYSREHSQVSLQNRKPLTGQSTSFRADWHLVALPLIQEESEEDPLSIDAQVEIGIGDNEGVGRLARRRGVKAKHVSTATDVADAIIVDQATAILGRENLER